jgi:nucleotide-binding universal stress UspA family protein
MPVKTILAVVGVDEADLFLKGAIDLCSRTVCHLSTLVVALAAPPPIGDYAAVVSDAWMEERQGDLERLDLRLQHVRQLLSTSDISSSATSLYSEVAWADEEIGAHALYCDLMLLGAPAAMGEELRRQAISGAIFEARIPLLLTPEGQSPPLRPETVLLAWDSSPDAAGAARDALDLLVGAGRVHVTMVDPRADADGNGEEPGADIAAYLARHGVNVSVDRLSSAGRPIADTLRRHAVDISADMIVMGAYGHSRLRERIFGGVTRSMLDNPPVPVFMSR